MPKSKPAATNVVDLMEALRRSVGQGLAGEDGQAREEGEESLARSEGDADVHRGQEAKETAAKKPAAKQRKSA